MDAIFKLKNFCDRFTNGEICCTNKDFSDNLIHLISDCANEDLTFRVHEYKHPFGHELHFFYTVDDVIAFIFDKVELYNYVVRGVGCCKQYKGYNIGINLIEGKGAR